MKNKVIYVYSDTTLGLENKVNELKKDGYVELNNISYYSNNFYMKCMTFVTECFERKSIIPK